MTQSLSPQPAVLTDAQWLATQDQSSRQARLRQQQLETLARQAGRVPGPVLLSAAFVALTVVDYVAWPTVGAWAALIALMLFVRWRYSKFAISAPAQNVARKLNIMVLLSFANGCVTGLAGPLFFSTDHLNRSAILSMILVCWSAGAVSANAGYARAFYFYAVPMLVPLATCWALSGSAEGYGIAVLMALFLVIQAAFVRDNERVFRQSFQIRYENERLIRELEAQRQAVMRERDRAEEANLAKSRFLAAASHDLRQPLHAVSLYSAALSLQKTDGKTRELAERIGVGISSLASLLDALLDISKLDANAVKPEPTRFAVDTLFAKLGAELRGIALDKGLSFTIFAQDSLYVYTDAILLERIVRNLADNATKYTASGGITLRAEAAGDQVLIEVIDTGPGIPSEETERVFEEFYQLSNPERDRTRGLGLGLAIVHRLTKLLGIELRLETKVGHGCKFFLSLQRVGYAGDARETIRTDARATDIALPAGLRVLVVDDEASIRDGMRMLLETWNCSVVVAGDLASALEQIERQPIDVLLADYRLRNHATGAQLVRAARAKLGDIPMLLISGDTAPDRLEEADALGVTFLHKPVSEQTLRRSIAASLRTRVPSVDGSVARQERRAVSREPRTPLSEEQRA